MAGWNLWHGCHKISPGCANCYVYRRDESVGVDPSIVRKTKSFYLPISKNRAGEYKIPSGETVFTCFSSDFFLEEADEWRGDAWEMIRVRQDLQFYIVTKRIHRFMECIPEDWGNGWPNVTVNVTVENQKMADYRMPYLVQAPLAHKGVACEPLLERVDLTPWLTAGIEAVGAGGESGPSARACDYDWILSLREQCCEAGVRFFYHQTGAKLIKGKKIYHIPRHLQHEQAQKASIDYPGKS